MIPSLAGCPCTGRKSQQELQLIIDVFLVSAQCSVVDVVDVLQSSNVDFIFPAIDTADGTKTSLIRPVVIGESPSQRKIIFIKINNFSRVIVFIIGGATFSEARCGYEISRDKENSWEVIVGRWTCMCSFFSNLLLL